MARTAPAYCELTDLLVGDLQAPRGVSFQQWIMQTADEMDAMIGQLYMLPITFDPIPPHEQDRLLLKKINAFLASGRVIMAMGVGGEDNSLHAYGKSLVDEAKQELARIAAGRTVLEAGVLISAETPTPKAPIVTNKDAGSYVDAFYRSAGTAQSFAYGYQSVMPTAGS